MGPGVSLDLPALSLPLTQLWAWAAAFRLGRTRGRPLAQPLLAGDQSMPTNTLSCLHWLRAVYKKGDRWPCPEEAPSPALHGEGTCGPPLNTRGALLRCPQAAVIRRSLHGFILCLAVAPTCLALLMLPLQGQPSPLLPSALHVTLPQKLVAAYVLGLLTMVFLRS